MLDTVKNLLKIKSIVTILITALFCVLSLYRIISGEQVVTIFTMIIGFYFGTQYKKGV